ncbi:MAG: hypothetical protein RI883_2119 [Bacteroidota bacterium]|jgi:type IX secretion system PorP/SprF family membrane protein
MKKILLILSLVSMSNAFAQQNPQYSQYLRNQYMVNPAAAGVYDFTDITMSGRWQWVGFGDEPRTAYLSGSTLLKKKTKIPYNPAFRVSNGPVRNPEIKTGKLKHAVGGQLIADQYGAFRKMQLSGTYAIHLPISSNYNLSFGTKLGLSNNTFLQEKAIVLNQMDPSAPYSGGDAEYDLFVQNQSSKYIMDLSAGLYLYSKKMFFGIAADNLTKDFAEFGSGSANFNTQMHFNLTGGVKIDLNDNLMLMPAILIKFMQPAPMSIEGSLQLEYKEWLWTAFSYRHKDAIVGMIGMNISERFKLGYSYDFSLSRFNDFSSGGHELVLGLMLGRK